MFYIHLSNHKHEVNCKLKRRKGTANGSIKTRPLLMKAETFACLLLVVSTFPESPCNSSHLSAMIEQFSFANSRADGKNVTEVVGEDDLEIGTVITRASFDYSDYKQGEGEDEDKDDSSTPSPLLWKNMNFPTSQSASSSPMHHYTSSRAQEIARYRKEMMDLVRGMPESAYELSLRDMVETPRLVKKLEEAAETRQEGAKNKAEKATDKSKGARRLQRNETMETGLFLKTFVPVLDGGKMKSSRSNSFAKVSPKPEAEKEVHGSIEGRRWNKNELRDRGSSSETSSRKIKGCCAFLSTNKSKSRETSKEFDD